MNKKITFANNVKKYDGNETYKESYIKFITRLFGLEKRRETVTTEELKNGIKPKSNKISCTNIAVAWELVPGNDKNEVIQLLKDLCMRYYKFFSTRKRYIPILIEGSRSGVNLDKSAIFKIKEIELLILSIENKEEYDKIIEQLNKDEEIFSIDITLEEKPETDEEIFSIDITLEEKPETDEEIFSIDDITLEEKPETDEL
jgi:hypothetical protein